jgi:hypothetical protein
MRSKSLAAVERSLNAIGDARVRLEEALIEMYLAGVSVRRVEDIAETLWGTGHTGVAFVGIRPPMVIGGFPDGQSWRPSDCGLQYVAGIAHRVVEQTWSC